MPYRPLAHNQDESPCTSAEVPARPLRRGAVLALRYPARASPAQRRVFAPSRAASAIGKGALPSELASLLPLRPPRSIGSLLGGRRGAPSDSSPPLPHLGQPPNARRRDRDIGGRRAVDAGSCHGLPKQDREHHRVRKRRDGLRSVGEILATNWGILRGAQEADDSWKSARHRGPHWTGK